MKFTSSSSRFLITITFFVFIFNQFSYTQTTAGINLDTIKAGRFDTGKTANRSLYRTHSRARWPGFGNAASAIKHSRRNGKARQRIGRLSQKISEPIRSNRCSIYSNVWRAPAPPAPGSRTGWTRRSSRCDWSSCYRWTKFQVGLIALSGLDDPKKGKGKPPSPFFICQIDPWISIALESEGWLRKCKLISPCRSPLTHLAIDESREPDLYVDTQLKNHESQLHNFTARKAQSKTQ